MNYEKDVIRFDSGYLQRKYESKGNDPDSIRARSEERLAKAIAKQKANQKIKQRSNVLVSKCW